MKTFCRCCFRRFSLNVLWLQVINKASHSLNRALQINQTNSKHHSHFAVVLHQQGGRTAKIQYSKNQLHLLHKRQENTNNNKKNMNQQQENCYENEKSKLQMIDWFGGVRRKKPRKFQQTNGRTIVNKWKKNCLVYFNQCVQCTSLNHFELNDFLQRPASPIYLKFKLCIRLIKIKRKLL